MVFNYLFLTSTGALATSASLDGRSVTGKSFVLLGSTSSTPVIGSRSSVMSSTAAGTFSSWSTVLGTTLRSPDYVIGCVTTLRIA